MAWIAARVRQFMRLVRGASPAAPAPEPPLRDPVTAHAALQLANAYLDELDGEGDITDADTAERARTTLALAARQLQIAHAADPTATFEHTAGDGTTVGITQAQLRALTVYLEGVTYSETAPRRAIDLLQQALVIDPDCAPAYGKLGILYYLECDRAKAMASRFCTVKVLDWESICFRATRNRR